MITENPSITEFIPGNINRYGLAFPETRGWRLEGVAATIWRRLQELSRHNFQRCLGSISPRQGNHTPHRSPSEVTIRSQPRAVMRRSLVKVMLAPNFRTSWDLSYSPVWPQALHSTRMIASRTCLSEEVRPSIFDGGAFNRISLAGLQRSKRDTNFFSDGQRDRDYLYRFESICESAVFLILQDHFPISRLRDSLLITEQRVNLNY